MLATLVTVPLQEASCTTGAVVGIKKLSLHETAQNVVYRLSFVTES